MDVTFEITYTITISRSTRKYTVLVNTRITDLPERSVDTIKPKLLPFRWYRDTGKYHVDRYYKIFIIPFGIHNPAFGKLNIE